MRGKAVLGVLAPVKHFRRNGLAIALALIVLGTLASTLKKLWSAETPAGAVVLDAFEQHGVAKLPSTWRSNGSGAEDVYRIAEQDGNRFLRARAESRGTHIGKEHVFDPKNLQHLQWRWRVRALPAGADERIAERHDAAAQVYVVFENQYWPRIIKFVWSTALPAGSRFTNPLYSRGRVVVLRSGSHGQSA
jgi:hypothetical protein